VAGRAPGTPAIAALAAAGVAYQLHPYQQNPAADSYGEEAASALGVEPARLFKTLIAEVDRRMVCALVPAAGRLDLKALASALAGKRAVLAEPATAQRATGYITGGISPLGQKTRLPMVVDASAHEFETLFVSAGRRGLQVSLAPADLLRLTGATTAQITAWR
jgi:Cys-tRNA(Pro)/Cys-tRNA(Cys) deacylase